MKPCCATCNKCIKTPYPIGNDIMYGWQCSDEILNIDDPYYDYCPNYYKATDSDGSVKPVGTPINMEDPYDTWR